jgi:hypothetical protein
MTPLLRTALGVAAAVAATACHPRPAVTTPAPIAGQNHPPSIRARCAPCVIEPGKTVTVSVDAQDPDADALSFAWSAPGGALATPSARETAWTAPAQEGPVPVAITVTDGKGGTATDAITIQVRKAAPPASARSLSR